MRLTSACIALAAALGLARGQEVRVPGFRYELIHSGNGMTAMDFDPAGRLFVCEKQGRVLVLEPDGAGSYKPPVEFADLRDEVNPEGESGLLGIALDPGFAGNRHVYLFHTRDKDQRLVRLTADAGVTRAAPGSAMVLLDGLPRTATNHKAGDIHFHPKDPKAIYVALGDDTRRDAATDPERYEGKLLRLDAATGKGLRDNPLFDGDAGPVRSRVWATGLRNPYRFVFLPGGEPDAVYISENGDGTDRLARLNRGADGGWGRHGDKGMIDPKDPNTSVLHTGRPCLTAIEVASTGPFADGGTTMYAANWFTQQVLRWRIDHGAGRSTVVSGAGSGEVFLDRFKAVSAKFGPDGCLYLTQTYYSESKGRDHRLARVVPETKR